MHIEKKTYEILKLHAIGKKSNNQIGTSNQLNFHPTEKVKSWVVN